MTGLGDKVRALHLGRRVDGGDPLLNTVWLDVPELRDALADALDAVEYATERKRGRRSNHEWETDWDVFCAIRDRASAALAAVARQLEDGGAL